MYKNLLLDFNNQKTNKITINEIDNDTNLVFTLLDVQKFSEILINDLLKKNKMKQDPLEQAAKEYAEMHLDVSGNLGKYLVKAVFQDGGKWEKEQDKYKFSEEDMKQFGLYLGDNFKKLKGKTIDEIFEQFKKK